MYDMDDPAETVELKLAPELRRAAAYAGGGIVVCAVLADFLVSLSNEEPLDGIMLTLAVSSVLGWSLWWWANHVRVRVDGAGVHRRILFHWQHWPWELFESGSASPKGYYGKFVFAGEPWYRKSVSIPSLSKGDGKRALEIVQSRYAPPAPEELPELVTFRPHLFKKIEISRKGIIIRRFGSEKRYQWDEVKKVVFHKPTRDHEDFQQLTCWVGDQKFGLACRGSDKQYLGAAPEKIAAYFEEFVAPERIVVCAADGPHSLSDADEQLATIRQQSRQMRIASWVAWIVVPVVLWGRAIYELGWKALEDPYNLAMLALLLPGIIGFALVPVFVRKELRKREAELLQKRDDLLRENK